MPYSFVAPECRRVAGRLKLGFDDRELAFLIDPPLTTVRVPKEQIGDACMRLLLARLRDPRMAVAKQVLPTELVERESVSSV
jgi:DNA-binding LacI/PurR family transcriptional regulator